VITVTMGGMVTGMEGMARISQLRSLGMVHRVMAAMPVGMASSAQVSALPCFSSVCLVLSSWVIFMQSKIVAAGRRKRDVADMADFWWFMDHLGPIMINGKYC
jgi:hypothetical protein